MNFAVWICLAVLLLLAAWGLARRGATPAAPEAPPRELTADERARVLGLRNAGDKIQAIKLHRELTGAGLAASKHAVESL
ncbi:MAG: ribosomal protein L7/L12 [Planctomycetes bacterium]|nr:ribosomal protein L7/L12 [Planctomycetota bacterium]